MTAAVSFARNAAARRLVERLGEGDERMLRDILGIVDERGQLLPDDTREYEIIMIETVGGAPRGLAQSEPSMTVRPKQSTAPDALRNLAPVVVPPKPVAAPKPKPAPKVSKPKPAPKPQARRGRPTKTDGEYVHGTEWGYKRHRDAGEDPKDCCRPCYDAKREAWKRRPSRSRGGRKLQPCGTTSAARRHRDHGEPVCEPCKLAERKAAKKRASRAKVAAQ